MVVKIYISGISGNKEVKKRQQRVLMILDSKSIDYQIIDITEPGKEDEKEFMQTNGIARESKYPLPPQIFNEEMYCGDYEDFDLANEMDELEDFLKVEPAPNATAPTATESNLSKEIQENGNTTSREPSTDKDAEPPQTDSLEERTTSDTAQSEESKPVEETSEAKDTAEEDAEHMEENADKNEEKSDDQEKEE